MLPTQSPRKKKAEKSDHDSAYKAYALFSAVGFQLIFSIVGGLLLGQWLDNRWSTHHWLTLIGFLLGIVVGFYNLFRITNWKNQNKK